MIRRNFSSTEDNQLIEIATGNAETRTVALADGSIITLINASKISYSEVFSDSVRQVFLNGEAYFEVAAAPRPFVVFDETRMQEVIAERKER